MTVYFNKNTKYHLKRNVLLNVPNVVKGSFVGRLLDGAGNAWKLGHRHLELRPPHSATLIDTNNLLMAELL